ncbi:hypothetical protein [Caldifermentibacillus hisashii]|uniref:hypothetical protein n=1 Tax=Caldifermentibacillus hisashii TaxID=996558 RepID=UPI001C10B928|nr:hypothetical protein [Caldifermentibacillus hisashii]MBU5343992.1 hypothetical protein [Caldifermentibacillus hisashii]
MLYFDDETRSRHRFEVKKCSVLATSLNLVTNLRWETLIFDDETLFSSPFWGEKHHFLTTKPDLVAILG